MITKKQPVKKQLKSLSFRSKELKPKKLLTKFRAIIRTKHPSYSWLKKQMPIVNQRTVIRFGSITPLNEIYPTKTSEQLSRVREINSIQGIKNSASKLLMKQCFTRAGVTTANWVGNDTPTNIIQWCSDKYPVVAKGHYGSRGEANYKLDTQQELETWMIGKDLSRYIFEKFHNYSREYRIHVTADGYFYTCRKMLKNESPEDNRWQRHDDNCVWILEENPSFDKPVNWNTITADCVKAMKAVGLDICGFDVKVQSSKDSKGNKRTNPEYIIIECNSACSMGNITQIKYKEALTKLLLK